MCSICMYDLCVCELCKTYTIEGGISCSCFSCQETVHECRGSSMTPMSWLHTITGRFFAGLWRERGFSIFVTSVSVEVPDNCRYLICRLFISAKSEMNCSQQTFYVFSCLFLCLCSSFIQMLDSMYRCGSCLNEISSFLFSARVHCLHDQSCLHDQHKSIPTNLLPVFIVLILCQMLIDRCH